LLPKIDGIGLKVLYLLIPGIIAFFIVEAIAPRRSRTNFESGLQIFLYGILSYAVEAILIWYWKRPGQIDFVELLNNNLGMADLSTEGGLEKFRVYFAAVAAVIIACTVAIVQTNSVSHRILRKMGLTSRASELDMWGFAFNRSDLDAWITVRHNNGNVYQGWIMGYSDAGEERELLLGDLKVYVPARRHPVSSSKLLRSKHYI
jgi:hypothetical protein